MDYDDVRISVVVPVFNESEHLIPTLQHFFSGINNHGECLAELIVVDDGSNTPIDENSLRANIDSRVTVVRQENQGRYKARQVGILQSSGNFILMFDSRVKVDFGSFEFLVQKLKNDGLDQVWVGPSKLGDDIPLIGHFWRGIEMMAWKKYYRSSGELRVGIEDIDQYPIGTTFLGVSKNRLLDAFAKNKDIEKMDGRYVSDDTILIRDLLVEVDAQYSLSFNCVYTPRFSLISFLKHAHHRGRVFVDGHLSKGSRYLVPWLAMISVAISTPFILMKWPIIFLFAPIGFMTSFLILRHLIRLPRAEALALIAYGPVFLYTYLSGTLAGLVYRLTTRDRVQKKELI
jgi:glycosyltransferase involved in cell wall biosynthesis